MSVTINQINGLEGQIELVGVRAIVATFYRWALERRGEDDAGNPRWALRAYFSYQKPGMLLNPKYKQVIRLKVPPDTWYTVEPIEDKTPYVDEGEILRLEASNLWPVQPRQSVLRK